MTREQCENAESILTKIRELEKTKEYIDLPPECYSVELRTTNGRKVAINSNDIGGIGVGKLVSLFKECIDVELEKLEKKLEEI